jgi:hypothetical protein
MNGNQYLTTMISGFSFFNAAPTRNQFRGLTELILEWIFNPSGGGSDEYWVLPGNRKEGYCREKE